MIELVAFVIFMIFLGLSIYQVVSLRLRLSKALSELVQSKTDSLILSGKLGEALAEKSLSDNEGFIKFLSTSRDWAYKYIEDVQIKIANLEGAMESGDNSKIDIAYKDLVSMMPKDGEEK